MTFVIMWDLCDEQITTPDELDEIIDQQLQSITPTGDPTLFLLGHTDNPDHAMIEFGIDADHGRGFIRDPARGYAVERSTLGKSGSGRETSYQRFYEDPRRSVTLRDDCLLLTPDTTRQALREYIQSGRWPDGLDWN